ncbi:MAG: TonB-dependent receptor [Xanthomonadales bacterium]|nr:TonB-dependent receptor [Xanthomonadales bacterium]
MNPYQSHTVLIAICSIFLASSIQAQPSGALEEVVVTATKREQTLQEVPIAVSVVDADVIEKAQINDIMELQSLVPSLRVSQLQTSGNTTFIIRGFGNGANNPGIEPSVGVFIDGVYRSRSAAAIADLPNLERVEVLRGPQTTLFGKNASAGVINVVTAAPNMDSFGGSASVGFGNYSEVVVKGDVSGPISDTLGFSLSVNSNSRDGYYDNLETGSSINERDRWGMRGQLLFLPTDNITLRAIVDYDKIDEKCCAVANLLDGPTGAAVRAVGGKLVSNAPFAYENYYDFDPTNEIENKGASLQADIDFSNDMLLTSITAYREQSRLDNADVDFTSARLISINEGDTNIDTFTQELRLSQDLDRLNWMVGAYYFNEDVSYDNTIAYDVAFRTYADLLSGFGVTQLEQTMKALGLLPPSVSFFGAGQGTEDHAGSKDESSSMFGQLDFQLTDRVTLTGGLNYTSVDKKAFVNQTNTDVFSSLNLVQVGFGAIFFRQTGLPPTPANIGGNPQAAGIAQALSTIPCSAQSGPFCNPVLGLRPLQFLPPFLDFPNSVEPGKSSDDDLTWTARIAFDWTDNINVYASAGTGFKATVWNLTRDSRPFPADIVAINAAGLAVNNLVSGTRYAGPEESTVYELGFKGNWARTRLNVAIFDQSIDGFQSNIFVGTGFVLANAGKQSTSGLELEATWLPVDALQLTFAGTWLDPKYDSFVGASGVNGPVDLSGTTPPGISKFSMSASATYSMDLGWAEGFIRGDYVYEDEVQVIENVPASVASREVSMFNASMGLAWSNGFEVILWGRNLTDDQFLQSAFPAVAQAGSYSGYPNQPRTYGVNFKVRF